MLKKNNFETEESILDEFSGEIEEKGNNVFSKRSENKNKLKIKSLEV